MRGGDRRVVRDLLRQEAAPARQVQFKGFAEEGVERLPRALVAAKGAEAEAGDPGQAVDLVLGGRGGVQG